MTLATIYMMLVALAGPPAAHSRLARELAMEIASVVDVAHPIFESAQKDAAVMAATAYFESSLGRNVIGDGGYAHCAYQLHGAPSRVLWDLHACTTLAYARLRASAAQCPDAPLAIYTSGSCTNRGGRRVSVYRMREAERVQASAEASEGWR